MMITLLHDASNSDYKENDKINDNNDNYININDDDNITDNDDKNNNDNNKCYDCVGTATTSTTVYF